jgi:beta-glucanase (GH16 family)
MSGELPVTESAPDPGMGFVPKGYELVFSDEFDGSAIDTKRWETLAPFSQPHLNDEIECYEPGGVLLRDGQCVLRAEERTTGCGGAFTWRSGSITSRSTWTTGYFEARLKLPRGQGLWPAFWLTSSKRWPPEWDILEVPYSNGTLFQYMHPTKEAKLTWVRGAAGDDSIYSIAEGMPNPYSGFVIYGCEVTAEGVKLWVNGTLTAEWKVSADSSDPLWVCLNLAVGGHWPGMPDATTPRPAEMVIDYLRIYQRRD